MVVVVADHIQVPRIDRTDLDRTDRTGHTDRTGCNPAVAVEHIDSAVHRELVEEVVVAVAVEAGTDYGLVAALGLVGAVVDLVVLQKNVVEAAAVAAENRVDVEAFAPRNPREAPVLVAIESSRAFLRKASVL